MAAVTVGAGLANRAATRSDGATPTQIPAGPAGSRFGLLPSRTVRSADRARLVEAADEVVDQEPRATDPLEVEETDGPFVEDAQAAWTLALAGHVTGSERYSTAAAEVVDAWVTTARSARGACPESGACDTSLMVSRSAPALVFAVDLLATSGRYAPEQRQRFRRWLRDVVLPTASDRDNNWGDAGTYLIAVVGVELGDREVQERAAARWRSRLDLVLADGRIPEEMRRGDASLMYSQDSLDYKVATAEVLRRVGIDLFDHRGAEGGTLRAALDLVAAGLEDESTWPGGEGDLRIPDPSGAWAIAAARWPTDRFVALARAAAEGDGEGHSAVIWTTLTHPPP